MKRAPHVVVLMASGLLAVAPAAPAAPTASGAPPVATAELSGTLLTVSPTIAFASATLRVAGPGGYEAIAWSQGEPLVVDLLAAGRLPTSDGAPGGRPKVLPDGRYGYEVVFYLESGERRVHAGSFLGANGVAEGVRDGPGGGASSRPEPAPDPGTEESNDLSARAGSTGEHFLIGDTDHDGEANLQIRANHSDGTLINYWGVRNQTGDLRLSTSNGADWVDYFTFKPAGQLGIGTTQPQADIHIYRPGGNIRITDSDACPNPNAAWEIEEDFGRLMFEVVPNCPGDSTGGKMWITGNGRLGIGTNSPASDLHINNETPAIRLSNDQPCPDKRLSWKMTNNHGFLDFIRVDECVDFASAAVSIDGGGRVGIGSILPVAKLHVIGDAVIEGDVAFGSSRTIKHEIEPLDRGDVLAAVRKLPLYHWKYLEDEVQALHVGPMAEDVHAAFGLGRDEKHLSPADSAGLALAAIQGLDREVAHLRAENAELAARNRELLERLAAIEARLAEPSGGPEAEAP